MSKGWGHRQILEQEVFPVFSTFRKLQGFWIPCQEPGGETKIYNFLPSYRIYDRSDPGDEGPAPLTASGAEGF